MTTHDTEAEVQRALEENPSRAFRAKRLRTRRIMLVGMAGLIIASGVWLFSYQTHGRYLEETNDAFIKADSVTISPKISGYVEEVLVVENQDVDFGQPLMRIDPRDYNALAQQYQAQIDIAKANADNVRATIGEQDAAIQQAIAQLGSAQEDARHAAQEAARYTPLAASGAETREQLSNLLSQARKARAFVNVQQAALLSAQRKVTSLKVQIRQAEAQGAAARAQLAAARVNVGSTILKASAKGRIGDLTVRAGQFVQAGTRLMSIVPLSKLYVVANFKETQIGLMSAGQPATIEIDALNGTRIPGKVESISPGTGSQFSLLPPQNATGNFTKIVQRVPARIAINAGPKARRVLVPGLSVTVTVDTISGSGTQDNIAKEERALRKTDK